MAREIAASKAASADAALGAFAARVAADRRSSVKRARDAVLSQFAAIEASRARIRQAALSAVEGERSARTLLALARALAEIEEMEREEARARRGPDRDAPARAVGPVDAEEDIEALRRRVAGRLTALKQRFDAERR